VATPQGSLVAPLAPIAGAPGDYPGVWPPAKRVDCADPPQDGEVCVPGGAYWMGFAIFGDVGGNGLMRIVSLSPFYMDATEMTVATFRATGAAQKNDPMPFNDDDGAPGIKLHCTYTKNVGTDELLPVNCISHDTARLACQAKGADLPTEAQFHYVSGALEGRVFVWGKDLPECGDVSYDRSEIDPPDMRCPGTWLNEPGSGARDRLSLPTGVIVDLAGNLSEHALDQYQLDRESCWQTGVVNDPHCAMPSAMTGLAQSYTVVGGSWLDPGIGLLASPSRQPSVDFAAAQKRGHAGGLSSYTITNVGFRCARPATPKK
jgi:formylglycine-generating enzyme required for sulfatase activity